MRVERSVTGSHSSCLPDPTPSESVRLMRGSSC
jgi:hypothetical protein